VLFQDEVAEHQCVIGDDDIGGVGASSGLFVEAVLKVGALSSSTVAVFAVDHIPDYAIWDKSHIA